MTKEVAEVVETLVSIVSTVVDAIGDLDPERAGYMPKVNRAYDEALKEAGLSLTFVREKLRPLLPEEQRNNTPTRFDDQEDIELIGEFLYLRHMHPDSTMDDILKILSVALDQKDEAMLDRMDDYVILIVARLP